MDEMLSHEELTKRLRNGWQFDPRTTPGLREAAREVVRPVIEGMREQDIVYCCRSTWLVHVDQLDVDDERFSATATVFKEILHGFSVSPHPELVIEESIKFGGVGITAQTSHIEKLLR